MAVINLPDQTDEKDFSYITLDFGYFKHGSMLAGAYNETKDLIKAFEKHGDLCRMYGEMCDKVVSVLKKHDLNGVELDADNHYVALNCNTELLAALVEADLGEVEDLNDDVFDWGDEMDLEDEDENEDEC